MAELGPWEADRPTGSAAHTTVPAAVGRVAAEKNARRNAAWRDPSFERRLPRGLLRWPHQRCALRWLPGRALCGTGYGVAVRVSSSDVRQGERSLHCYFLAALAALAGHPHHVRTLFLGGDHAAGIHAVRLWWRGRCVPHAGSGGGGRGGRVANLPAHSGEPRHAPVRATHDAHPGGSAWS